MDYSNMIEMDKIIIASDVSERDGLGIEVYRNKKLIVEIFRDDSEKTRTISTYDKDISLELMEEAIAAFKKKIPWDFVEIDNL